MPLPTSNSSDVTNDAISVPMQSNLTTKSSHVRQYRPESSALPTSLIRTILVSGRENEELRLPTDNESNEKTAAIPTTIVLQLFSDRIFLSITQRRGKMGSLLVANVEESIIDNSTVYNIRTLLGTGGPISRPTLGMSADHVIALREVYARRLAERIVLHARKMAGVGEKSILGGNEDGSGPIPPLLLGLALLENSNAKGQFNEIIDASMKLYEEGWRLHRGSGMDGLEGPD